MPEPSVSVTVEPSERCRHLVLFASRGVSVPVDHWFLLEHGLERHPEDVVESAFDAIRKGGTVTLTGLGNMMEKTIHLSGTMLTLFHIHQAAAGANGGVKVTGKGDAANPIAPARRRKSSEAIQATLNRRRLAATT